MKILVISQNYWPDNWRINVICEGLVSRGHSVTVLTGMPASSDDFLPQEAHNEVSIVRVHDRPRKKSKFSLFRHYSSFVKKANKAIETLADDFDLVLVNQLSPVMQIVPGARYAKKHGKKLLVYCLDLWPESLCAGGVQDRGMTSLIYRHYLKKSRALYGSADRILVTSKPYLDYLAKVDQVPLEKMAYLPQFAEPLFSKEIVSSRKEGIPEFAFAGNVGQVQDVETIIRAASILSKESLVHFTIVGDGSDLKSVKSLAAKLGVSNVTFAGRLPLQEMPSLYASCSALLLTLDSSRLSSLVVPGKLQAYLASGKPVICACNGAASDIISASGCGFAVSSGDAKDLAATILRFVALPINEQEKMGDNGRHFYETHFSEESFFKTLEQEMINLTH